MSFPIIKLSVSNTPVLVQGTRLAIFGGQVYNTTAGPGFLLFYDAAKASDVVVGTTPLKSFMYAPPQNAHDISTDGPGLFFSNGCVIACVSDVANPIAGVVCHVEIRVE